MICLTDRHRIPFQIDADDFEALRRYCWYVSAKGYVATNIGKQPPGRRITLHLFLLGPAPPGLVWDHINWDKLDNRRANLRAVTPAVNSRNVRRISHSGVVGVKWNQGYWRARIKTGQRDHFLGRFRNMKDAVAARLIAEERYWGDER